MADGSEPGVDAAADPDANAGQDVGVASDAALDAIPVCPPNLWSCPSGCVDETTDTANCGACGHSCYGQQWCADGTCKCPLGTIACGAIGECLSGSGQCCTNNDCAAGAFCPKPGGSCECASGNRYCAATGSCISMNDCCANSDCAVAGSSCPVPGQPCQCSNGEKACAATNSCIPQSACCTASDCQPGQSCTAGQCV